MTPLRQRMMEDMRVRNLSPHTQSTYVLQVSLFARYFHKPPDQLGPEEIRSYQVYLTDEKKLAPCSIVIAVSALRFLYKVTLHKDWSVEEIIPAPKKPQKLPVVLSPEEVQRFLSCVANPKHQTILTTCYAAGLRISEVIRLRPPDIDSQRMVIRVEQGKGQKDRVWAAAHTRSYVPGKVMCSGRRQNLRRQAPGSDRSAHNYLPLNDARNLSVGRKDPRFRLGGRTASSISRFCEGSARRYASVL
jgi:site-specific recombinase XerD